MSASQSSARPELPKGRTTLETLAFRVNNTTGKEQLPKICVAGYLLETLWHARIERHVLGTPGRAVRSAMVKAAIVWPSVYVVTGLTLKWAKKTVDRIEGK